MKYRNAKDVLPKELLGQIQEYVQGEYIYIPIKEKREAALVTGYQTELEKRDAHIYTKYLEDSFKTKERMRGFAGTIDSPGCAFRKFFIFRRGIFGLY